ncbi:MAG TPA: polysaccharide biosynthesis/export family protein [Puia sp.]|nr:polysaccharide biosynthesis/export family protein [Puia sp.]
MKNHLIGCAGALILFSFLFPSCANTRNLTYMQGTFDTAQLSQIKIPEARVRPGDLLSIIFYSDNPELTAIFNQSLIIVNGSSGSSGSGGAGSAGTGGAGGGTGSTAGAIGAGSPTTPGYLVDEDGDIQFQPPLGLLHVEGLTRDSLKILLDSKMKKYVKNPYYTIRFMNYRFTMLGEVSHPGIFSIPGEHISLLDAIGLAGDLTLYGRRDNILVIREYDGKREWARLDLTKPDILLSPYYYLQQNDVVYVEATRKKVSANDQSTIRTVSIAATIISTIAIVISLLRN